MTVRYKIDSYNGKDITAYGLAYDPASVNDENILVFDKNGSRIPTTLSNSYKSFWIPQDGKLEGFRMHYPALRHDLLRDRVLKDLERKVDPPEVLFIYLFNLNFFSEQCYLSNCFSESVKKKSNSPPALGFSASMANQMKRSPPPMTPFDLPNCKSRVSEPAPLPPVLPPRPAATDRDEKMSTVSLAGSFAGEASDEHEARV
jgi:hypothetical protein